LSDISENKQLGRCSTDHGRAGRRTPDHRDCRPACRRVEAIAPDVVASVLHVDSDGLVHPLGGPSLPDDYSRALEGIAIGPDVGSCGSAAYYGKPVLAENLDTDPRWQPYKARPLEVGLKACWSTPIKAKDGRVIGTFAFYFREPRRRAAGISGLSTPAFTSVRWRSSERKPGPRSPGSPTTTC
jgi:GAF domain-containing protein